ncbi:hypothetical protein [Chryseobacterium oncorhynchi]|uniref:Pectate lyase superfamily protein domain-containing protein n=1 Tax=Chryseobacterium oncorhynchi TaxID=741074 RepID=A0A316WJT6_9FLAO|nr:hypothetical protein [Chryseobacterium oncorhynchi]PWN60616.1 hypothetical protein C1638_019265 [Chryseobacterium oncorhynchi]
MVKNISTLLYICFFPTVLACNKKKEALINYPLEQQKFQKEYSKFSSLKVDNDTINGSFFGIKADFNGKTGTDNRKALQIAVDYCSKNKKTLVLPKGKILLNSFGISDAAKSHNNIIDLKSNTTINGSGSEIIIGNFFDDKNFIVFSGFNASEPLEFTKLENIGFSHITIDFSSSTSYMKNGYRLRKAIEFGHTINGYVTQSIFKNGDLTCAIASGYGKKNISSNIKIFNNRFINLIKSEENEDHTTVYINSQFSEVYNNIFTNNSTRGKLIACATELHNSNTKFYKNTISGYTRMMYVAATDKENYTITNINISNNTANITNAAIYLWLDQSTAIENIIIENNNITSTHVKGYSMLYNGTQGLLADARNNTITSVTNMVVRNNNINIKSTAFKGRAVKYSTNYKFKDINNQCSNCKDGNYYK